MCYCVIIYEVKASLLKSKSNLFRFLANICTALSKYSQNKTTKKKVKIKTKMKRKKKKVKKKKKKKKRRRHGFNLTSNAKLYKIKLNLNWCNHLGFIV